MGRPARHDMFDPPEELSLLDLCIGMQLHDKHPVRRERGLIRCHTYDGAKAPDPTFTGRGHESEYRPQAGGLLS